MYTRQDGRLFINDENGTCFALSFQALMGFVYWAYNNYDVELIEEGNIKFATAMHDFIEDRAETYMEQELL